MPSIKTLIVTILVLVVLIIALYFLAMLMFLKTANDGIKEIFKEGECKTYPNYTTRQNLVIDGKDMGKRFPNLDEAISNCNTDPICAAVDQDGVLRSDSSPVNIWFGKCLYTRNPTECPAVAGYHAFPDEDVTNNTDDSIPVDAQQPDTVDAAALAIQCGRNPACSAFHTGDRVMRRAWSQRTRRHGGCFYVRDLLRAFPGFVCVARSAPIDSGLLVTAEYRYLEPTETTMGLRKDGDVGRWVVIGPASTTWGAAPAIFNHEQRFLGLQFNNARVAYQFTNAKVGTQYIFMVTVGRCTKQPALSPKVRLGMNATVTEEPITPPLQGMRASIQGVANSMTLNLTVANVTTETDGTILIADWYLYERST